MMNSIKKKQRNTVSMTKGLFDVDSHDAVAVVERCDMRACPHIAIPMNNE